MNPLPLAAAALLGFAGGAHCLGMCGGIAGGLCAAMAPSVRARPLGQLALNLAYNTGRLVSYAGLGLAFGNLGLLAGSALRVGWVPVALRLFAAAVMLFGGVYLTGLVGGAARVERLGAPLWRHLEPYAKRLLPVRSFADAMLLGLVWGWLPCGMVYSAIGLAVASGSAGVGALTMLAFGAGTLPAMLTAGLFAGAMAKFARRPWIRRSAGVVLVAFALVNAAMIGGQSALFGGGGAAHDACAPRGAQ